MSSAYYVGLDVGGTTMKAGVVDDDARPLSAVSLHTEASRGQELGLERMAETMRRPGRAGSPGHVALRGLSD
jgi:glucokinase